MQNHSLVVTIPNCCYDCLVAVAVARGELPSDVASLLLSLVFNPAEFNLEKKGELK